LVLALRLYRPYGTAGTLGGIARDFLTIRMDKPETGWPIAARRTNPDDRGGEGLQCAFNARAPAARAMPASTCAIELAKAPFAMTHLQHAMTCGAPGFAPGFLASLYFYYFFTQSLKPIHGHRYPSRRPGQNAGGLPDRRADPRLHHSLRQAGRHHGRTRPSVPGIPDR